MSKKIPQFVKYLRNLVSNSDTSSQDEIDDYEKYLDNQVLIYLENMPILRMYDHYIDSGKTAVDIGANRGELTWYLLRKAQKVVSFEPLPSAFAQLSKIQSSRLQIHNIGLSNETGSSVLHVPFDTAMNDYNDGLSSLEPDSLKQVYSKFPNRFTHIKEHTISIKKLDDFNLGEVSTKKIDVEGHELEVIEGAKETIFAYKPSLLVEIAWNKLDFDEAVRLIEKLGYSGYYYDDGGLRPISALNREEFNFLFLPK